MSDADTHYLLKLVSKKTGERFYATLVEDGPRSYGPGGWAMVTRMFAWRFQTAHDARGPLRDMGHWRFGGGVPVTDDYVARVVKVTVKLTKWSCDCLQMATEQGDDGLERCVGCGRH